MAAKTTTAKTAKSITLDTVQPMNAADVNFGLDMLGAGTPALQFIRELHQNAIEGIFFGLPTGSAGQVIWNIHRHRVGRSKVNKLAVIDTGCGMTGEKMVIQINSLFSSGKVQSHQRNFGIGAKIAGLRHNPAGLLYYSWVDGVGYKAWLRRQDDGSYGMVNFQRADGTVACWDYIDDAEKVKPDAIGEHGTMVVCLGKTLDADTTVPLPGARQSAKWVSHYLNSRFFRFPDNITVKAREFAPDQRGNVYLRSVTGMRDFLSRYSLTGGCKSIDGAKVHWWILDRSHNQVGNNNSYVSTGHFAALFQDELYEMQVGGNARTRMLQFGVTFGAHNVVLYVEPTTPKICADPTRTHLMVNNPAGEDAGEVDWATWGEQFTNDMPPRLAAYIEEQAAAATRDSDTSNLQKRLKKMGKLFVHRRYRPAAGGEFGCEDLTSGSQGANGSEPRKKSPSDESNKNKKRKKSEDEPKKRVSSAGGATTSKLGSTPAKVVDDLGIPQVRWVTAFGDNPTRAEGDNLEDRVGTYIPETDMLILNADFRYIADLAELAAREKIEQLGRSRMTASMLTQARAKVREEMQDTLCEAVVGAKAMAESGEWDVDVLTAMFSEDGLTMAVMPRTRAFADIKRSLGA